VSGILENIPERGVEGGAKGPGLDLMRSAAPFPPDDARRSLVERFNVEITP